MEREDFMQRIGNGAVNYLRAFALADTMERTIRDGIEWISPKPGCKGPSLVYEVDLDDTDMERAVDGMVAGINAGSVPPLWFVSPGWKPGNIMELLLQKGFRDVSNPAEPEPGMALDLSSAPQWPEPGADLTVKRVLSTDDFAAWCRIANGVLHGWDMVTPGHYASWLGRDDIALYLATIGGMPAATAAVMRAGEDASIEFVATLPDYRRRGAATAACTRALTDMQAAGVRVATLRAFHDGVRLYERLGFRTVYHTVMLSYPTK